MKASTTMVDTPLQKNKFIITEFLQFEKIESRPSDRIERWSRYEVPRLKYLVVQKYGTKCKKSGTEYP